MTNPDPIRLLEEETLRFAQELLRIESVNTGDRATVGDGEARAVRYIQERLEEVGIHTEYAEAYPGRGNLVARIVGATEPGGEPRGALVAHAHVDVVPVHAADWTHPPFGGEIHDGELYGRGALDMKHYVAVLVAVARSYARSGIIPARDLIFAFFSDEESGGADGVRWVLANRPEWLRGATEAISEVGGFSARLGDKRAYLLATAEKGVGSALLTARGTAGHGSRPTNDNPVTRLAQAVAAVGAHRFPVTPTPAVERFATHAGELLGRPLQASELEAEADALGAIGVLVSAGLRSTATPTILSGGTKSNVVPGSATAYFDVRFLPGAEAAVQAEIRRLAGDDIHIEWGTWTPAIDAPVDGALVDVLQAAIEAEDPDGVVVPYLLPASTDNKYLGQAGIAGYGFVPLKTPDDFDPYALFHAADERIPVESLHFAARVTERILRIA